MGIILVGIMHMSSCDTQSHNEFLKEMSEERLLFDYCKPEVSRVLDEITDRLNQGERDLSKIVSEAFNNQK